MILSNSSIPLLGIIDTAMVGYLPNSVDIAAVALGSMVFNILFWAFGFLRMSTTGIAAQNRNDTVIFFQSAAIALIISLILIIASPLLKQITLWLIHAEPEVKEKLANYFSLRILSTPATLLNYVIIGFFFGRQDTRTPLFLIVFTNLLAMFLDYYFVWHQDMGANGIAIANVIAQLLGSLIGLSVIYNRFIRLAAGFDWHTFFDSMRVKKLLTLNRDIFIRTLCLMVTLAFFTRQSATFGMTVVAANTILMHMQLVMSYALDGFAIAAETLIGDAVGKNDTRAFKQRLYECGKWSLLTMALFMFVFFVFGQTIINLMTNIQVIRDYASHYLIWIILLPLVSTPSFLLDGVFIGATWSKPLRNTIVFASIIVFFPLWALSRPLGNHGLWLAYSCFILSRGIYLGASLKHKWTKLNGSCSIDKA
jgi:MATE family, multidrug efflux pump